jgi:uracil-DNA glycosylase family 4
VVACRACPRLVAWREEVARRGRGATSTKETYWARPVPGFGDPAAKLVLVGLAPAAHGGNRAGRMFTGDRSGDFLYAALHRAGYANQALSVSADDGLTLAGAYVTAPVRCAPPENKPTPAERDNCAPFLTDELAALEDAKVYLALGAFALESLWRQPQIGTEASRTRPKFAHGAEVPLREGRTLLCSYHPSQRNVFTGLLTPAMFDGILARAGALGAGPPGPPVTPGPRNAPA